MKPFRMADLFCGAGGTSTGAIEAVEALGYSPQLTAVNHWDVAIETHAKNHPGARHLCTSVDDVNPRSLYRPGELDLLWASPECTHHSQARGGKPINEQSRATAWCVIRWAEALQPGVVLVENVPEFETWGAIGSNGRPLKSKRGATFLAWVSALESMGYSVDWRVLCAADYGDPTTRRRLFIQATRGRRKVIWPEPLFSPAGENDLFGMRAPWRGADTHVIDWSIPTPSLSSRSRSWSEKTIRRINDGLTEHGSPIVITLTHGGRARPAHLPLPTVTCANRGELAVAYLLPQGGGGAMRSATQPVPTVATKGAIALILKYYGTGITQPVSEPLPSVTTKDRFALVTADGRDVYYRLLQPHELAAAQGFRRDYQFTGTKTEQVKQIGNAVPRRLARALCLAALSQRSDIRELWREAA